MLASAGLVLSGMLALCGPAPAPAALPADTVPYATLYDAGTPFGVFLKKADQRVETWQGNFARAVVAPELQARARAAGRYRLLVIAEDWCGDSANTIPYLARLVDQVPNLEMRIVDSSVGRPVMEAHRTPDGRAATPTVVVLDAAGAQVGCWVERPARLQTWFLENETRLERDVLYERKYAWYDEDAGASTVSDIVALLEGARAGRPLCPGG